MKKIKYIVLIFLLLFSFNSYAEIEKNNLEIGIENSSIDLETSDENIELIEEVSLTSNGEDIDFDMENFYKDNVLKFHYIYYYGEGCVYCASLDRYLNSVNGYEKLNIEKREVYRNSENSKNMMADAERLGLDISSIGVPFFIINTGEEELHMFGDKPIIDFLSPVLGDAPENKNKTIILSILAVFALILPVFLIKLSNKN